MERITRQLLYILQTALVSQRGTCLRAQVGCIIVKDGRVICTGYNGSPPDEPHCIDKDVGCEMRDGHCIRTVHAEANAIAFAARHGIAVEGADLYTFGWENGICSTCRKLSQSAGIKNIIEIPQNDLVADALLDLIRVLR